MENITGKTVGAIVAEDYRTAAVFTKYNIDFCCHGNVTVAEASTGANAQPDKVLEDLAATTAVSDGGNSPVTNFDAWPLDLLTVYIEKKHHRYVSTQIPEIKIHLDKICTVHGGRHPELFEINALFHQSASEFITHMKKEELMLFPFINNMAAAAVAGAPLPRAPFGNVESPIESMMHEHDAEGERFRTIRRLSADYTTPADGCNTYKLVNSLLKAFEEDLHLHIHLENNILFPKAIKLEHQLRK